MSQQPLGTPECENDDLCAVLKTCQTEQEVEERLSAGIRQYVFEGSFERIEALVEAAECSEKPELMERAFALIKSEIGRCDIPQDDNGPAMRGTLMAIPFRVKPAVVSCLGAQVPTPATALSHDAAAAIVSHLPWHPHRRGAAYYVAKPHLLSTEDLTELTFEHVLKMTAAMKAAFIDARGKLEGCQSAGLSVKPDDEVETDGGAEHEATCEVFTTVDNIPRTLYLLYLQVEEPDAKPLGVKELNESERIDFGVSVAEWDGLTCNLLRAAFGRELEFHIDNLPGPFFEAVDGRDIFEWFWLVHETLSNQLALTRVKVDDARVFVDFNRLPSDGMEEKFEAEVFLTTRNEKVLGSLYFDLNPGETPEDVIGGVEEIVTTLGISEYYPPSRAWWHKEGSVEAVEYNGYFGPAPRRSGDE